MVLNLAIFNNLLDAHQILDKFLPRILRIEFLILVFTFIDLFILILNLINSEYHFFPN